VLEFIKFFIIITEKLNVPIFEIVNFNKLNDNGFIVFNVSEEIASYANDKKAIKKFSGTIRIYEKNNGRKIHTELEEILNENEFLTENQNFNNYEDDTQLFSTGINFEFINMELVKNVIS
jgi:hypothetical protein